MEAVHRRSLARLSACLLGLALGSCENSATTIKVNGSVTTDFSAQRHSQASPRGAPVAFASLEGPPRAIGGQFARDLASAVADRDISIADGKKAHYFVRGYLTAYAADGGTEVDYVWDVFDSKHHRAQRVTDGVMLKGAAEDPWTLVDEHALGAVAAKSADDLAGFLATTPEAQAAASAPANPAAATQPVTTAAAQ